MHFYVRIHFVIKHLSKHCCLESDVWECFTTISVRCTPSCCLERQQLGVHRTHQLFSCFDKPCLSIVFSWLLSQVGVLPNAFIIHLTIVTPILSWYFYVKMTILPNCCSLSPISVFSLCEKTLIGRKGVKTLQFFLSH